MTILKSIKHSQILLQQITNQSQLANNVEITNLLTALASELKTIRVDASQLIAIKNLNQEPRASDNKPEMKSGCYVFANIKGFFCPHCYDNTGHKIPTKRMNSKLRVCPSCRSSIS